MARNPMYTAPIDALAFTTATDVFEITVTSDSPIIIARIHLCQTTDLGDAAEEVLRIGVYTGVTAGSTGTALTEGPWDRQDNPSVTAAIVANRGTASSGGTLKDVIGWNIRIPLDYIYTPDDGPRVDSTEDVLTYKLLSAPTDSITVSGSIKWWEG